MKIVQLLESAMTKLLGTTEDGLMLATYLHKDLKADTTYFEEIDVSQIKITDPSLIYVFKNNKEWAALYWPLGFKEKPTILEFINQRPYRFSTFGGLNRLMKLLLLWKKIFSK